MPLGRGSDYVNEVEKKNEVGKQDDVMAQKNEDAQAKDAHQFQEMQDGWWRCRVQETQEKDEVEAQDEVEEKNEVEEGCRDGASPWYTYQEPCNSKTYHRRQPQSPSVRESASPSYVDA